MPCHAFAKRKLHLIKFFLNLIKCPPYALTNLVKKKKALPRVQNVNVTTAVPIHILRNYTVITFKLQLMKNGVYFLRISFI